MLSENDVRCVAGMLRSLLAGVEVGELCAPAAVVGQLRGSIVALEALAGDMCLAE